MSNGVAYVEKQSQIVSGWGGMGAERRMRKQRCAKKGCGNLPWGSTPSGFAQPQCGKPKLEEHESQLIDDSIINIEDLHSL